MYINTSYANINPRITTGTNKTNNVSYPVYGVSFGHRLSGDKLDLRLCKSLAKLKDFTIKDYSRLTSIEKLKLRIGYYKMTNGSDFYSNTEQIHEQVTDNMKEYFDKKYGKDNYTIIIIGRSLSSLGKVLGYKIGEENVKQIPMSDAYNFSNKYYVEQLHKTGDLKPFKQFLSSMGLERRKIEGSKRKYIIMDYCVTGDSINGARTLLKQPYLLGPSENIKSCSVMKCIPDKELKIRLDGYLKDCLFKDYSFVQKSPYIEYCDSKVVNPQQANIETKLMWFKLLDNYMQTHPQTSKKKHSQIVEFFKGLFG